jgi:hypothetical protein
MANEHPKTHSYCNEIIETGKWVIFKMHSGNEKLFHLVPSLENVDLGKVGSFQVKLIYIRKTFWRLFRNP